LAQRVADFRVERDRINVGRREGRFSALRIAVKGAPSDRLSSPIAASIAAMGAQR